MSPVGNTNHHVVPEAGLVPVPQVVDVPQFLQEIVVIPAVKSSYISPLAALAHKDVLEAAGAQSGSGSVIQL